MAGVNVPIRKITPADSLGNVTGPSITDLPAPVSCDWEGEDFSAPEAGRLESGRLVKMRRGKADKLVIVYEMLTRAQTAFVLTTFSKDEYFKLEYLNARVGEWITETFVGGDQAASDWMPVIDSWGKVRVAAIRAIPDLG